MKVEKVCTVTISKEEREKVMNAIDVLETFLSEVDKEDINAEESYDVLLAINYQDEDVCIDNTEIVLRYE